MRDEPMGGGPQPGARSPEPRSITSVGVLGCGLMGAGIAQVCAQSGYRTVVREVEQGVLDKGLGRVRRFLDDGVQKGKVTAEHTGCHAGQPVRHDNLRCPRATATW